MPPAGARPQRANVRSIAVLDATVAESRRRPSEAARLTCAAQMLDASPLPRRAFAVRTASSQAADADRRFSDATATGISASRHLWKIVTAIVHICTDALECRLVSRREDAQPKFWYDAHCESKRSKVGCGHGAHLRSSVDDGASPTTAAVRRFEARLFGIRRQGRGGRERSLNRKEHKHRTNMFLRRMNERRLEGVWPLRMAAGAPA
eukprot:scaffold62063_cov65-Phaeocystis_antarctica.AAC.2